MRLFQGIRACYSRAWIVFFITVAYTGYFVAPHLLAHHAGGGRLLEGAFKLTCGFVQIYCLFFALTISRVLWVAGVLALGIFSVVSDYFVRAYGVQLTKDAVAIFFETTSNELREFLTLELVMAAAAALLAAAVAAIVLPFSERKEANNRKIAFIALMMSVLVMVQDIGIAYPPYNFLTAAYNHAVERVVARVTRRRDIAAELAPVKPDTLTVVLVIGESARADHFSLNGYERKTTPLLEKRERLVNFPNAAACGSMTRTAVPCMLTRTTPENKDAMFSETSLISVFRRLGFHTVWLDAQGKYTPHDPTTAISSESSERIFLEEQSFLDNTVLDEHLLPLLDVLLARHPMMLVILHTYGSHWQYAARYPRGFAKWLPEPEVSLTRTRRRDQQMEEIAKEAGQGIQTIVNSYDNSILYTDWFLDRVIRRVESRNAIFLYLSDHGESLGEEGRYLHGHETRDNYHVPMLWWASDAFIRRHPGAWRRLQSHASHPITQHVVFHSLLGCVGMAESLLDQAYNLCSDAYKRP